MEMVKGPVTTYKRDLVSVKRDLEMVKGPVRTYTESVRAYNMYGHIRTNVGTKGANELARFGNGQRTSITSRRVNKGPIAKTVMSWFQKN